MTENETKQAKNRAVLVGLNAHCLSAEENADDTSMEELADLLETAGGVCVGTVFQNKDAPDPRTFIGEGKAAEVKELVGAMVAVLFLVRTDRAGLLRRRGSGFFNGLLVGMYPLVFIGYNAFGSLVLGRPENGVLQPAARIGTFLVSMAMVGVAEEFIFRGVIAQTLLEHFGTSRAGVWKACLLSGVLFGAAHLTNILSSAPFGVLMQCVFAASLGTLFAAVYFRTGNLWVTVFLHGAMDISSMLIGGLYGTTTVADAVSGYDASMLLSVLLYLIPTAVLLRKKKLPEVQLYWHQYVKK